MTLNIGYTKQFTCETCSLGEKRFDYEQIREHLLNVHNIPLNGVRTLIFHAAKKPRHTTIYEWKFANNVIIHEINF